MTQRASGSVARISRNALVSFILLLAIVFLGAEAALFINQRRIVFNEISREIDGQVMLLGQLAVESVLRSDYTSVSRMLEHWAASHRDVLEARVTFPNGFELTHFRRGETSSGNVFDVIRTIEYGGKPIMVLSIRLDRSDIAANVATASYRFAMLIVVVIGVLGWIFWAVLRRTAIIPYEEAILRHEEVERELKRRTQELESLNDELNSFCYSISHDLRAPLRAIDGFGQILGEDYAEKLDDTGRSYLDRSRAAARRIGQVIDDLLRLTSLTRQTLVREEVDLSAMAREVLAVLSAREPSRDVSIQVESNLTVQADAGLARIVFENLLGNAWKYTSKTPDAFITFGVGAWDGQRLFYVRDNGAGFDPAFAHKLFNPFQRLHTEREFPGTGIGLATVARIIQRHGGIIRAFGTVNGGATFAFSFGG